MKNSTITALMVAAIVILTILVAYLLWMYAKREEEIRKQLSTKTRKLREERRKNEKLSNELERVCFEVGEFRSWKRNVQKIHPNIESEIDDLLAREEAERFDKTYELVPEMDERIENYTRFEAMMFAYQRMSQEARIYVRIDLKTANGKWQRLAYRYLAEASEYIIARCSGCEGTRKFLPILKEVWDYYQKLPVFIAMHMDRSIFEKLNELYEDARVDEEENDN